MRTPPLALFRPRHLVPGVVSGLILSMSLLPGLHAQSSCSDGGGSDALGCDNQQPVANPSRDTPSTLNVFERGQSQTPSADRSNPASANGSLSNDANFSEYTPRNIARLGAESRPLALEPPTEFQIFVAQSTGQLLPVYGAKLFANTLPAFGPIDHGPAPAELIVGVGDELRIRIWGQVNFSANLRVSREGDIYLPKVGSVHVAGMPFSALSDHLRAMIERVYRNFDLSVDMGEIHTIQIYASGMARQPGEYTVSALNTLVDAVFAIGGPSGAGSMRHIQLKRAGKIVTDFDLYALLVNGDKSGDVQLESGDVLYIPAAGPQVAILGSVRQAGIYELRGEESIDQLLQATGGKTATASGAHMLLDRIEDHTRRRALQISGDPAGLATLLADGDILRVDPVISTYHDTVTLRGAVANPGHFLWHSGMRLSEILPERDALLKRDYWWQRTRLGLPAPQVAVPALQDKNSTNTLWISPTDGAAPVPGNTTGNTSADRPMPVQSPAAQTNWNQADIERLDTTTMTTHLLQFNLGKLVLEHDATQDLELQPGDVITIFSQRDIQLPIHEQTIYVELTGEFAHPGVYSVTPQESLQSLVERTGGLTKQAYLYGAVFSRKSTQALEQSQIKDLADQLDHQLARNSILTPGISSPADALQAMAAQNRQMVERIRSTQATGRVVLDMHEEANGDFHLPAMRLEDGDRLEVPFEPQTVQVFGSVFNPHAFLFHPDAQVGEFLHLAGGPNRDADRRHIFVLRADGSVMSRDTNPGMFSEGLSKMRLHPGDSIVVPEKSLRPSAMNTALAWAQAVSGTTLTALEVNALK
jgi:polysaccharide biosynthesis/export protein